MYQKYRVCISKFQNVRVRIVFPQPKQRPPKFFAAKIARPGFSAAKIARPGFFRSQNGAPKVFCSQISVHRVFPQSK